jgi:hemerythrin-like metal-binding protein
MARLEWTPRLVLGIKEIDEQHKAMVEMINALDEAIASGQDRARVVGQMDELIRCSIDHFGAEESLFIVHGWREKDSHKDEHDEFVTEALDLKRSLEIGRSGVGERMRAYLAEWMSDHILGPDKRYVAHMHGQGIR